MKYHVKIVGHGPEAFSFLGNPDGSFFILFNEDAPEELAEISVLHTKSDVYENPAVGDTVKIAGKEFIITAVGAEVPYTLKELGHCTINFSGDSEAELPGYMTLAGCDVLTETDLQAGVEISIY